MPEPASSYQATVTRLRREALGIVSLQLEAPALPPAPAGSHVDLVLAPDLRRSYSLFRPSAGGRYDIAVQREAAGAGGSRHVHERVAQGDVLTISAPRNHFALRPGGAHHVLVAGGIGITPLYAMLQTLAGQGGTAQLFYCARSRERAAFLAELRALASARIQVECCFEDESGRPDVAALIAGIGPHADYYCCGPAGMLAAFEQGCEALGYPRRFIERFAAAGPPPAGPAGGYEVALQRCGRVLAVGAGQALLDVLLEAGCDVAYSCREGACGACETAVVSGEIEHRDQLLSDQEKAAGRTMLVCVSGARSGRLVLDL